MGQGKLTLSNRDATSALGAGAEAILELAQQRQVRGRRKLGPRFAAEAGLVATLRMCAYIDQQKKENLD